MKKILPLLSIVFMLSCSGGSQDKPQALLLVIKNIIGHSEKEVAAILGKSTELEDIKLNGKKNPKYGYKDEAIEIVYIDGKADWITLTLNNGTYDKTALGIIGLPIAEPTISNKNVIRWQNHEGMLSISLFPKTDGTINYFYIKTVTP